MTANNNIGIGTATHSSAPLQFANVLGNKVVLYNEYGFGIENSTLAAFVPAAAKFALRQSSSAGTEVFSVSGAGAVQTQGNLSVKTSADNVLNLQTTDDTYLYTAWLAANGTRRAWTGLDSNLGSFNIVTENGTGPVNIIASGGLVVPGTGANARQISFGTNVGGGGGDTAWMRWYAQTGENTRLEIRTQNDADDDIFIRGTGGTTTGTGDLAELYAATADLQLGDVVVMDPTRKVAVRKSSASYQSTAIGVTSARQFALLMALDASKLDDPTYKPVTLAGRIPTKISLENGPIHAGDPLTTASTPGFAMKATEGGIIIGSAFEDFDGSVKSTDGVEAMYGEASKDCHDCEARLRVFPRTPKAAPGTHVLGIMTVLVNSGYWSPRGSDAAISATVKAQGEELAQLRSDVEFLRMENDSLKMKLATVDAMAERLESLEAALAHVTTKNEKHARK